MQKLPRGFDFTPLKPKRTAVEIRRLVAAVEAIAAFQRQHAAEGGDLRCECFPKGAPAAFPAILFSANADGTGKARFIDAELPMNVQHHAAMPATAFLNIETGNDDRLPAFETSREMMPQLARNLELQPTVLVSKEQPAFALQSADEPAKFAAQFERRRGFENHSKRARLPRGGWPAPPRMRDHETRK